MTNRLVALCVGVLVTTCRLVSADMQTRIIDPKTTDRFYSGSDKAFWASNFNFSGVGNGQGANVTDANPGGWATLITDHFFLSADHDHPSIGSSVTFHSDNNPNGPSVTYTVTGGERITIPGDTANGQGDLWLGQISTTVLGTPTSHGITPYAIAANNEAALTGSFIVNVGVPYRVGTNNIDTFSTDTVPGANGPGRDFYYDFNTSSSSLATESHLQTHDSGGPSFVPYASDQLALVDIHWAIGTATYTPYPVSADTYVSYYNDAIQAAITNDFHSGDHITIVSVPEPSSLALVALGLGAGLIARSRRRPTRPH